MPPSSCNPYSIVGTTHQISPESYSLSLATGYCLWVLTLSTVRQICPFPLSRHLHPYYKNISLFSDKDILHRHHPGLDIPLSLLYFQLSARFFGDFQQIRGRSLPLKEMKTDKMVSPEFYSGSLVHPIKGSPAPASLKPFALKMQLSHLPHGA